MPSVQGKRLEERRNEMLEIAGDLEGDLLIVQRAIEALKETAHRVSYIGKAADTYVACRAGYAFENISAYIKSRQPRRGVMPRDRFIKLSAEFDSGPDVSQVRVVLDADEETEWVEFRSQEGDEDDTDLMFFVTPEQMNKLAEWWIHLRPRYIWLEIE